MSPCHVFRARIFSFWLYLPFAHSHVFTESLSFFQLEAEVAEKKKNLAKELKKIDEDYAKAVNSNRI